MKTDFISRILIILSFLFVVSCTEIPEYPTSGSLRMKQVSAFFSLQFRLATENTFQIRGGFIPVGSEVKVGQIVNNLVIENLLPGTYVVEYFLGSEQPVQTIKVIQIIAGKETVVEL